MFLYIIFYIISCAISVTFWYFVQMFYTFSPNLFQTCKSFIISRNKPTSYLHKRIAFYARTSLLTLLFQGKHLSTFPTEEQSFFFESIEVSMIIVVVLVVIHDFYFFGEIWFCKINTNNRDKKIIH